MAKAPRKTRSDSADGQIKAAQAKHTVIEPPEGITFETEEKQTLWRQFTAARAPDAWREFDLLIIAKMVEIEINIRKHNKMIERTSAIIENKRGTMVENPLLRVVDTLQRQQLAMIRTLSLGVSSNTACDLNRSGSKAQDKSDLNRISKGDVVSLLAR